MPNGYLLKRKDGLEISELPNNDLFVYDKNERVTHYLNSTLAFIWLRCDGKSEKAEIERGLKKELKLKHVKGIVHEALDRLDKFKLLR